MDRRVRQALVLFTNGDLCPICLAALVVHVDQADAVEERLVTNVLDILADGHALDIAKAKEHKRRKRVDTVGDHQIGACVLATSCYGVAVVDSFENESASTEKSAGAQNRDEQCDETDES